MSQVTLTGERLDDDHALFGPDLARHRAAYLRAIEVAGQRENGRTLDLGCGNGYGSAEIADAVGHVVALDRITPDAQHRRDSLHYVRADLAGVPLVPRSFDLVVSFQVIEHLEDPTVYMQAIANAVRSDGTALVTTPNILMSDGVNPFHIHEYESAELCQLLEQHFEEVEMLGVGMSADAARYQEDRLARIRRIMRLDPFGLRNRLPRKLIDWLFAQFSIVVRRGIQKGQGLPDLSVDDFPIGPADGKSIDLLAVCRKPRSESARQTSNRC
ncbi:MAG TPA: class I SAM-dependent methyltransferase [Myxococcales bacterium]|nr:class I SAM-dependent methyltransferase [Myxococcales bacterium]